MIFPRGSRGGAISILRSFCVQAKPVRLFRSDGGTLEIICMHCIFFPAVLGYLVLVDMAGKQESARWTSPGSQSHEDPFAPIFVFPMVSFSEMVVICFEGRTAVCNCIGGGSDGGNTKRGYKGDISAAVGVVSFLFFLFFFFFLLSFLFFFFCFPCTFPVIIKISLDRCICIGISQGHFGMVRSVLFKSKRSGCLSEIKQYVGHGRFRAYARGRQLCTQGGSGFLFLFFFSFPLLFLFVFLEGRNGRPMFDLPIGRSQYFFRLSSFHVRKPLAFPCSHRHRMGSHVIGRRKPTRAVTEALGTGGRWWGGPPR
mmetsp:Transcript_42766/g.110257  ORF Transcript_42766/g.110257 Transcript_42766/m.110257 type:complete len:312 (+) Transcript_42766:1485-2420(+)